LTNKIQKGRFNSGPFVFVYLIDENLFTVDAGHQEQSRVTVSASVCLTLKVLLAAAGKINKKSRPVKAALEKYNYSELV
jgi:hypothetical protein